MGRRGIMMPELTVRNPLLDENGAPVSTDGAGYASSMAADPGAGRYRNDVQSFATPYAGAGAVSAQERPSMAADGGQQGIVGDGGGFETVGASQAPQKPTFNPQDGSHVGVTGQPITNDVPVSNGQVDAEAVKRNPYQWLMDKFSQYRQNNSNDQSESDPAEAARKEANKARIAGLLGLFTGIGNMLVTSSNRFGRAVQSPDFAKPVAEGIVAREKKRREDEQLQREQAYKQQEQAYKQQQMDLQRQKMLEDSANKKYDRDLKERQFKANQEAKQKELELKAKNYADLISQREKDRKSRESINLYNQKKQDERQLNSFRHYDSVRSMTYKNENKKTHIQLSNNYTLELGDEKWKNSPENVQKAYEIAYSLHPEFFESEKSKWYSDGQLKVNDDLRRAIASYMNMYEFDDVTKFMVRLNGDDPDSPGFYEEYFMSELDAEPDLNGTGGQSNDSTLHHFKLKQ